MNGATESRMNGATTSRADRPGSREGNRERWRAVVAEQRSSGESKRAFCRGRGISYASFLYWSKRFAEDDGSGSGGTFCEFRLGAPPVFEIAAGGLVVRVASGFDAGELVRLLRAVFEASPVSAGIARSTADAPRPIVEAARPC